MKAENETTDIQYLTNKYPSSLFERLLIKTDLESHTVTIYEKLIYIKSKGKHPLGQGLNSEMEEYHYYYERLQEKKRMIQLILFINNNTSTETTITLKNNGHKVVNNETYIQKLLLDSLINEYKNRNYHINGPSEEEAYEIIMQLKDLDWVREYFENSGLFILRDDLVEELSGSEYLSIFNKDKDVFVDIVSEPFYNEDGVHLPIEYDIKNPEDYIDELDIVSDYIADHQKTNELSMHYFENELKEIESIKPIKIKPKPKNYIVYLLISYILGLKSNNDTVGKITREDCRLIHDILVFFDFITDVNAKSEKEKNTTSPETYIRSIYDYHSKNQAK